MDIIKPQRFTLEQAQMEAEFIRSTVGLGATPNDYESAHSQLIQNQTKEKLKGKNLFEIYTLACVNLDQIESKSSKVKSIEFKISEENKKANGSGSRIGRLETTQDLLATSIDEINNGAKTLDIGLYNDTLLLGFMEAVNSPQDGQIKDAIFEKLRQAEQKFKAGNQSAKQIDLSNEELAFVQNALPITYDRATTELKSLKDSHQDYLENASSQQSELRLLKEGLAEAVDVQKTTINALDELEETFGAPKYPDKVGPTQKMYQAYLDRIAWRKNLISEWGMAKPRKELPWGRELGRKWAFFKQINGNYLLLNHGREWDDVHAAAILTYRVPGTTFALYAEGMVISKTVSVQQMINNGITQDMDWDSREQLSDYLQNKREDLVKQMS